MEGQPMAGVGLGEMEERGDESAEEGGRGIVG